MNKTTYPLKSFTAIFLSFLLLSPQAQALSTKTPMPEFVGIKGWINSSKAISKKSLEGEVLLLYFWNYSNTHSLQSIQMLDFWQQKYGPVGLRILGIHCPAYDFEKHPENIKKAVKRLKLSFPIALDSERVLWGIYNIQKSPSYALIDSRGRIREVSFDFTYKRMEESIRSLLAEKGSSLLTGIDEAQFPEAQPPAQDFTFGSRGLTGYGNSEKLKSGVVQSFNYPQTKTIDFFYLQGTWKMSENSLEVFNAPSALLFQSNASGIYLIAGSQSGASISVEVLADGKPLTKSDKGQNLKIKKGRSYLSIQDFKPYEITRQTKRQGYRTFELRFENAGVLLYVMSFD